MVVDQSTPSANPLGLNGFEFVEFTSPDPAAMDAQFVALGFTPTHRHPTKNVTRYKQGRINLMLNRDEAGRVAAFRGNGYDPQILGGFNDRIERLYGDLATEKGESMASCRAIHQDIDAVLVEAKNAGKKVVGYGAPGKGNTLLNYCGIGPDFIDFTVDRNPHKHGRFTPGTHIPVLPVEALDAARPDYVLILPWNLRKEIVAQMSHIREWGGKFVVPIPEAAVIEPESAR